MLMLRLRLSTAFKILHHRLEVFALQGAMAHVKAAKLDPSWNVV